MARALVSLSDLKTKYKGAGVFTMISDESLTTYNAPGRMSVLVPGFSKVGWFNRPFVIDAGDIETARNLFGGIDKSLEKRGSFFHRSIEILLKAGSVIALNLMKFDDSVDQYGMPSSTSDKADFLSLSVVDRERNGGKNPRLYSSYFKKDDWFIPSPENLLSARKSGDRSILNLVNLSQQKLTFIVLKSSIAGYDITLHEWFDGDVPDYLDPETTVNDYIVEVIALIGDHTNRQDGLTKDGVIAKHNLEKFLSRQDVVAKFRVVGSMLPDFRTKAGENLSIERMINSSTIAHGVLCAVDNARIYDGAFRSGALISKGLKTDSSTDIEFMSYILSKDPNKTKRVLSNYDQYTVRTIDLRNCRREGNTFTLNDPDVASIVENGESPVAFIKKHKMLGIGSQFENDLSGLLNISKDKNDEITDLKVERGQVKLTIPRRAVFRSGASQFTVVPQENKFFFDGSPANTRANVMEYAKKLGFEVFVASNDNENQFHMCRTIDSVDVFVKPNIPGEGVRNDKFDIYDESGDIVSGVSTSGAIFAVDSNYESRFLTCDIAVYGNKYTFVEDAINKVLYFMEGCSPFTPDSGVSGYTITTSNHGFTSNTTKSRNCVISVDENFSREFNTIPLKGVSFSAESGGEKVRISSQYIMFSSEEDGRIIQNSITDGLDVTNGVVDPSYHMIDLLKKIYDGELRYDLSSRSKPKLTNYNGLMVSKLVMESYHVTDNLHLYKVGQSISVSEFSSEVAEIKKIEYIFHDGYEYAVVHLDKEVNPLECSFAGITTDSVRNLRLYCLDGFQVNPKRIPDGSNKSIRDLYSVISETNIGKALSDPEAISFRYMVDTFNGGIEANCKHYISKIAQNRDTCLSLINLARADEFAKHTNPRFTKTPGVGSSPSLEIKYIVEGGNKSESPEWLFSLPEESQGASHSAFFFPNISVVESDGSTISVPPAAYVAACFMRKFGTTDEYKPSAGLVRGLISGDGVSGVDYRLGTDDYRSLIEFGVNPIIMKNGVPIIYGNETGYQRFTSALNNIHARDFLITVTEETRRLIEPYVFDYNDDTMRSTIRTILNGYYGGLRDAYRAIESFKITIDRSNNPGWVIDNDAVIIDIEVTITGVAKKFINRISLKGRSVNQTGFTII